MFPPRFRRFLDDLVDAADVVLAYEAPLREGAREVGAVADRHTLRRAQLERRRSRRPGVAPAGDAACVAER